jgi:hypothetical protein
MSGLKAFFLSRWRGEVPLAITFWRDMIFIGTALNILSALFAITLHAAGAPTTVVLSIFFAPLPWNLFLYLAVWQSANRATPFDALTARTGGVAWLIAVTII